MVRPGESYDERVLKYLLIGGGFAFAAAVQPGPLQAFLLSRVAAIGWRRTLPAALAPLLSDGPIALLALLVLGRLSGGWLHGLRAAGGVLLLYLAWSALGQWRRPTASVAQDTTQAPRTLLQAALVNLFNPHPYLGWALVLGPTAAAAWRLRPHYAVALVAAFYVTMVVTFAATIAAMGSARLLGPRGQRLLQLASALVLAGLGACQLALGAAGLA